MQSFLPRDFPWSLLPTQVQTGNLTGLSSQNTIVRGLGWALLDTHFLLTLSSPVPEKCLL